MAEIRLTAVAHEPGGPDVPIPYYARIRQRDWPGGVSVSMLCLDVGLDQVEVWPAEPRFIESLGRKLIELADEERQRREAKHG